MRFLVGKEYSTEDIVDEYGDGCNLLLSSAFTKKVYQTESIPVAISGFSRKQIFQNKEFLKIEWTFSSKDVFITSDTDKILETCNIDKYGTIVYAVPRNLNQTIGAHHG